jgi:predicted phage tail protein
MTTIIFEGYLGKIFGKKIQIHLGNLNKVIDSIDCVKNGFRKKLIELSNKGCHYSIIRKDSNLYFVPILSGSGKKFLIIIAVVLVVVGVGALMMAGLSLSFLATGGAVVGSMSAATTAAASAAFLGTFTIGVTTFSTLGVIASALVSTGLSLLVQGIMAITSRDSPQAVAQQTSHTGGNASSTEAQNRSFLFSNNENSGTQGNRIPIGYGRYKCSSNVIFVSLKSFDTNSSFEEQIKTSPEINYN